MALAAHRLQMRSGIREAEVSEMLLIRLQRLLETLKAPSNHGIGNSGGRDELWEERRLPEHPQCTSKTMCFGGIALSVLASLVVSAVRFTNPFFLYH